MALAAGVLFSGCNEDDPPFLEISSQEITIEAEGSTASVEIRSNVEWTIDCLADWCSTNITKGKHLKNLEIIVPKNTSVGERTGTIVVKHSASTATITVRQKGADVSLELSEENLTFYRDADQSNIVVACNNDWSAVSSKDWCKISPATGTGNAIIAIEVEANTGIDTRMGTVSVMSKKNDGTTMMRTINVEQKATKASIIITPKEKTLGAVSETFSISVLSNIEWNVTKDSHWISVDRTSGNGDGEIVVTVADNITGKQRTGNVSVSAGSVYENRETYTVTITQSGDDYFLEVPVTEYYLTESDTELAIRYQIGGLNCVANAETSATWLTLDKIENGVISYKLDRNEGSEPRSANIIVYSSGQAGAPINKTVNVTQSATGYILDIFFSDYELDPDGETKEITPIASIADLELLSNAKWCEATYDPITKKIMLKADINQTGATRTAKVKVSMIIPATGERISKEFTVTQDKSNYMFEFAENSVELSAAGGVVTSRLNASGNWKISNAAELPLWFSVTPASGSGMATIIVTAKESLSTKVRSFTILFQDEKTGKEISLVVIQLPLTTTVNKYVGRGYDATGEYANDHSVRAQFLDWDAMLDANMVADMVTLNDMNEVNYYGTNSVSYQEKLSTTINAGGNYKLFNLQVTSTTSSTINESKETEMGMFKHMTRDKALYIYSHLVAADLRDYLTDEAKSDIDNMDIATLITKYGTHVLSGAVTGGSLEYTMAADRKASSREASWDLAIKGGFSKEKVGDVSAGVNYNTYTKVVEGSSNFSEKLVVRGGAPQYASGLGSQTAYDSWLASLNDQSKLVLVDFYGSKLLPLWEFAGTTARRDAIKTAVEKYIKDTEIILKSARKKLIVTFYGMKKNFGIVLEGDYNLNLSISVEGDETEKFPLHGWKITSWNTEYLFPSPKVKEFSLNKYDSQTLTMKFDGKLYSGGTNHLYDETVVFTYDTDMSGGTWVDKRNLPIILNNTTVTGNNELIFYEDYSGRDPQNHRYIVGVQWLD